MCLRAVQEQAGRFVGVVSRHRGLAHYIGLRARDFVEAYSAAREGLQLQQTTLPSGLHLHSVRIHASSQGTGRPP